VHPAYAESQPWRQAIRVMGRALVRLFLQPSASNHERALVAVDHAISRVQATDEPFARHFDTSVLRRAQSYLHFIRTSCSTHNRHWHRRKDCTMPREIAFHGVYMPTMTLMFLFALGLAWGWTGSLPAMMATASSGTRRCCA
jgi:hypothetical protein